MLRQLENYLKNILLQANDTLIINTYSLQGDLLSSRKKLVRIQAKSQLIDSIPFCKKNEFKIRLDGKTYDETIGIRIEDNLVMTDKGCINLSNIIPKSVGAIERLMAAS